MKGGGVAWVVGTGSGSARGAYTEANRGTAFYRRSCLGHLICMLFAELPNHPQQLHVPRVQLLHGLERDEVVGDDVIGVQGRKVSDLVRQGPHGRHLRGRTLRAPRHLRLLRQHSPQLRHDVLHLLPQHALQLHRLRQPLVSDSKQRILVQRLPHRGVETQAQLLV